MFCQKCGTEMQDSQSACSNCKTPVAHPAAAPAPSEKVKAASQDAWQALKTFGGNPVGGLSHAFESLGPSRAFSVGIIFGIAFALCIAVGAYSLPPFFGRPQRFTGFIQILVVAMVPFVSLFGASAIARKMFRGEGSLGYDSFVAGASLLPYGCVAVVGAILGTGNIEVIAVFMLFALCLNILMLFASLTRICKMSDQAATIAIPLMLLACTYLSKIIYCAMMTN